MVKGPISHPGTKIAPLLNHDGIRSFYDTVYYEDVRLAGEIPANLRRLAARLGPWKGKRLLDVACGTGQWLRAATELGGIPTGIDISHVAIDACRRSLPQAELHCGPAERLPFEDHRFDFVSCLGSLEHFLEPERALREMVRVAKSSAAVLLLVPNADFIVRRLGLFSGTHQAQIREQALTLEAWQTLFESAGLEVDRRWRDLHILSRSWIFRGRWYAWPLRLAQALILPFWPLSWQYQVFHLCRIK